ncbi:MAG: transglutaminase-like domain-containing protein [Bacteroidota bacterium]
MKKRLIAIVCMVFVFGSYVHADKGDDPNKEFEKYKAAYPDEQVIYLKRYEEADISIVGDSLRIVIKHYEEMLHLGENSTVYAKDKVYSSHFSRVDNLVARTLIPVKKKYKPIPVTDIKESFDSESYVFYDDSKYLNFIYPAVQQRAKTTLAYDEVIKDPHFLGSYFFSTYLPIVHSRYSITVDNGVELQFKYFNGADVSAISSEKSEGGRTTYTFEMKNVDKEKYESNAPTFNYRAPHVSPIIKHYTNSKGDKINVLSSPKDLYQWYTSFISDLKDNENEEVAKIVNEIVTDQDTELEKVKKIYRWVQENIKYIAFEDGMRGFVPHNGAYVCDKRYGDCKDMSSIIVNMLHHAGVNAHFTWVGTRDLPYKYSELPTPSVDNHMIATYIKDGNYYFLDATSQYNQFGLPSAMIQGKECLIAIDDDKFEIKTIPEIKKETNVMYDTSSFKVTDGQIIGSGKVTLTGYAKTFNTYKMVNTDKRTTDRYITRLLSRGSNKFFVDQYDIANLEDPTAPIELAYDFRVEDYYKNIGDEIYFNMHLDKAVSGALIEEDRKQPIENDYKYINHSVATLEIPDGYTVKYMPEDTSFENDVFGFSIRYIKEESGVTLEKQYYLNYLLLEPKDFDAWNDGIKKFSEANRQVLILKKKDN